MNIMKDCYKKENLELFVKASFSLSDVSRKIGLAVKGKRKSAGGFKWKYKDID